MWTGLGVGAAVGGAVLLVWAFQRHLIYFPLDRRVPSAAAVIPGSESVELGTGDGLRLGAWFVPAKRDSARATVLVFNGNAGNRSYRAPLASALSRVGFSVLLFDYRGYGGNAGKPSEAGLVEDARAARRYVLSRDDVDPERIVYLGESLGAAVAVALAAEVPPAALVLRSPFTTLADVGRFHYPVLPVRWLLVDRYDSLGRISTVSSPVLVIAGGRDRIVPVAQSRRLYEAARGSKRFVLLPDADHNDFDLLAGERFIAEIVAFLEELPGPP